MNFFKNISERIRKLINSNSSNHNVIVNGDLCGGSYHAGNYIKGNGKIIDKDFSHYIGNVPIETFKYGGSFNIVLDVKSDNNNSIRIEGEENIVNLINVKVKNNTLYVETDANFSTTKPVTVYLSSNSLHSLKFTGSLNCTGSYISDKIDVDLKGSGSVSLEGKVSESFVQLTGSGEILLNNLLSDKVVTKLSGSGRIYTFCSEEFKGTLIGSGDIIYEGNPGVSVKDTQGSGSIVNNSKKKLNKSSKTI